LRMRWRDRQGKEKTQLRGGMGVHEFSFFRRTEATWNRRGADAMKQARVGLRASQ
jgi:hypothetical protein